VGATSGVTGDDPRRRRGFWRDIASYCALRTVSSRCRQKLRDANEILGGGGEHEEPLDQAAAAMAGLAQAADRLHPAETFFDTFALDGAEAIAAMPGGARIDRRAAVSFCETCGVQPRSRQPATKSAES